jgi:hypothetical protein
VLGGIESEPLNYLENQLPTAIAPDLVVSAANSTTLAGATVQITRNYTSSEDRLGFGSLGNISGQFNAATGMLELSGIDTLFNYQTILGNVTYQNTSENPSPQHGRRHFLWTTGRRPAI